MQIAKRPQRESSTMYFIDVIHSHFHFPHVQVTLDIAQNSLEKLALWPGTVASLSSIGSIQELDRSIFDNRSFLAFGHTDPRPQQCSFYASQQSCL